MTYSVWHCLSLADSTILVSAGGNWKSVQYQGTGTCVCPPYQCFRICSLQKSPQTTGQCSFPPLCFRPSASTLFLDPNLLWSRNYNICCTFCSKNGNFLYDIKMNLRRTKVKNLIYCTNKYKKGIYMYCMGYKCGKVCPSILPPFLPHIPHIPTNAKKGFTCIAWGTNVKKSVSIL